METRELTRSELELIWTIDRTETIENVYHNENGRLVLRPEHYDMRGWPPRDVEVQRPLLRDCFERGGVFCGVFDEGRLVAVSVLENRFMGRGGDQLQLKFLHVSDGYRAMGVGTALFRRSVETARSMGARSLYVSATPSENTVRFYLRRGCRVVDEPDPKLFELEPEDIHLEFDIHAK